MSLNQIKVNNTIVTSIDNEPTVNSDNLVKSKGVREQISQLETIIDPLSISSIISFDNLATHKGWVG